MDAIQVDYDNVLIGRLQTVDPSNFFGVDAGGTNQNRALSCIRYAVEKILEWDDDKTISSLDEYTVQVMKLGEVIKFIDFPIEVPEGNPQYILSLLYPTKIKLSQQRLVENTFQAVLDARKNIDDNDDDPENEKQGKQFPREYFSGAQGFYRFCYCINYLLQYYKPMRSIAEIYEFFNSPDGKKFLYRYRLKVPADQFSISMLDVIHHITRNHPDSDWWYFYYSFCNAMSSSSEAS